MSASEIVNKVPALSADRWNYAHVLRDDGVGYGDYVEATPGVLPPAALEHPCSSLSVLNEVPHECV